jgi:glycosyltransferase involved in cell wall biosynthesis
MGRLEEIAPQGRTWRPFGPASALAVSGAGGSPPAHDVCVIVTGDEDEGRLASALAGVLERSDGLELDAVVVEGGSDGSADSLAGDLAGVRRLRCSEPGLGHARNRALETVDARYVLFIGAEMEICDGELADLASALDERPEVALVAPRHVRGGGSAARRGRFRNGRARTCDWVSRPMLVRWAALESVGWFDERLFRLAGEMDLRSRMRRAGWEIAYVSRLTARRCPPSGLQAARLEAQAAYGRLQFARKHFPNLAADYRAALVVRYGSRVLLDSLLRRGDGARREAARFALKTVLTGAVPPARDEPRRGAVAPAGLRLLAPREP